MSELPASPVALRDLLVNPKDLARWGFWVPFRDALDPEQPEQLRRLWPLWRLLYRSGGAQKARMAAEYRAIYGTHTPSYRLRRILRDAYRVAFRTHLEELLMGKLDAGTVDSFLDLKGREQLDRALELGKGAIVLSAHAGSFMLPIASLSLKGYPYTQYAARGMPPEEVARAHPEVLAVNRWQEAARRAREESEDRLPARFLTLTTSVRELYRRLARNELVAIAFDGRIGNRWVRAPYLRRQALLNPGAYRLSANTGAPIVPALCRTPRRGPSVCELRQPILPEGRRWQDLMRSFLEDHADPWMMRHPGEYGTWLAHCRLRNSIDDHPLFIDHAMDDRWRQHPVLG